MALRELPKVSCRGFYLPEASQVPSYLKKLGYPVADATAWATVPVGSVVVWPKLEIQVTGHSEDGGHTWYHVDCVLTLPVGAISASADAPNPIRWRAPRRLRQLREDLHDRVRSELGAEAFKTLIPEMFAMRGGLPGTTALLNVWSQSLARCITAGRVPPRVAAYVLQFLETPADEPSQAPNLGETESKEVEASSILSFGPDSKANFQMSSDVASTSSPETASTQASETKEFPGAALLAPVMTKTPSDAPVEPSWFTAEAQPRLPVAAQGLGHGVLDDVGESIEETSVTDKPVEQNKSESIEEPSVDDKPIEQNKAEDLEPSPKDNEPDHDAADGSAAKLDAVCEQDLGPSPKESEPDHDAAEGSASKLEEGIDEEF